MTDKARDWREFWATQDPDDMDGVYIMSEDQAYIEDHEKEETKFKVVEAAALEAVQAERDEALQMVRELVEALNKLHHKLENYEGESMGSLAMISDEAIAKADEFLKRRVSAGRSLPHVQTT